MIVKTKKYQLEPKIFRRIGLWNTIKGQWWLPAAIFGGIIILNLLLNLVYPNIWIYFFAPLGVWFYYLFWWVQFTGAPHLEQNKVMFEKFTYEIDSRFITMKANAKEGMQLKWDMIREVQMKNDAFIFYVSKAQFVYLPFKIFNNQNDIRFVESLIRRKKLLPEKEVTTTTTTTNS